jgi:hypothetical protein
MTKSVQQKRLGKAKQISKLQDESPVFPVRCAGVSGRRFQASAVVGFRESLSHTATKNPSVPVRYGDRMPSVGRISGRGNARNIGCVAVNQAACS